MSVLAAVTDLVLPVRCAGCGTPGHALCPMCVPGSAALRRRWLPAVSEVVAAAPYDGAVRAVLLAWKERGRTGLTRTLAPLLAGALVELAPRAPVLLVPVPSSAAARRSRGADLVTRLCLAAGARCGLRTATGALRLTRAVADSAGLGRHDRIDNLRGAFAARAGPRGVGAVLVDDIVTTGTTLTEAAGALLAAGWPVLGAVAVASTPRPGSDPAGGTVKII